MDMQRVRIVVKHAYYPQISKGGVPPADRLYFPHIPAQQYLAKIRHFESCPRRRCIAHSRLYTLYPRIALRKRPIPAPTAICLHICCCGCRQGLSSKSATSTCLRAPPTCLRMGSFWKDGLAVKTTDRLSPVPFKNNTKTHEYVGRASTKPPRACLLFARASATAVTYQPGPCSWRPKPTSWFVRGDPPAISKTGQPPPVGTTFGQGAAKTFRPGSVSTALPRETSD